VFGLNGVVEVVENTPIYPLHYGLLYNLHAIMNPLNITSEGAHIITKDEYYNLLLSIEPTATALVNTVGQKLKESGITYWTSDLGINSFLMNFRGGGYRIGNTGQFDLLRYKNFLWNNLSSGTGFGQASQLLTDNDVFWTNDGVSSFSQRKTSGCSARAVKNSTDLSDGDFGTYVGNDGKQYMTVCVYGVEYIIGNLAETKYRDGSTIPEVTDNTAWAALTTGALCAYNNDWSNV